MNMIWHDLDFFEFPPIVGAGLGDDVFQVNFDGPGQYLVPIFCAPNQVIPQLVNTVAITLDIHIFIL